MTLTPSWDPLAQHEKQWITISKWWITISSRPGAGFPPGCQVENSIWILPGKEERKGMRMAEVR